VKRDFVTVPAQHIDEPAAAGEGPPRGLGRDGADLRAGSTLCRVTRPERKLLKFPT